jgi:hypothetical protein
MLVAALGMALPSFILTQCLAELAAMLPQGGRKPVWGRQFSVIDRPPGEDNYDVKQGPANG